jgi:hypothetical protein
VALQHAATITIAREHLESRSPKFGKLGLTELVAPSANRELSVMVDLDSDSVSEIASNSFVG